MASTSDYDGDPRVDGYIARLPEWQQDICNQLRDLIHAVDWEMSETIKRRDRPYFVLDGDVCALWQPMTTSTSSSTTGPSSLIPRESSQVATATQRHVRSPTTEEKASGHDLHSRCSSRSLPTTALAAGGI